MINHSAPHRAIGPPSGILTNFDIYIYISSWGWKQHLFGSQTPPIYPNILHNVVTSVVTTQIIYTNIYETTKKLIFIEIRQFEPDCVELLHLLHRGIVAGAMSEVGSPAARRCKVEHIRLTLG